MVFHIKLDNKKDALNYEREKVLKRKEKVREKRDDCLGLGWRGDLVLG